jgi:dipeptidyl aminopeptidase/acylaminoacyl peptidase
MYPPTDLISLARRYRSSERRNLITQLFAGTLQEKRREMFDASPVFHVTPSAPPFYLLHGQQDRVVPVRHSRDLQARLRAARVPTRLDEFPELGHAFTLDEAMLQDVAAFFRRHL